MLERDWYEKPVSTFSYPALPNAWCLAILDCAEPYGAYRAKAHIKIAVRPAQTAMVESKVMIFGLFRGRRNASVIERLHGDIVAAAREPVLFTDYGIPDTIDGRFESIALHAALALRHLKELPAPGPEIAQDLADAIFRHFDIGLREMGVSDTGVSRRMRDLAEAFLGRANAYNEALTQPDMTRHVMLAAALARNVFGDTRDGEQLAYYAEQNDAALAQMSLADFLKGPIFRVKAAANFREVCDE
jgi:cytochrome b pre-mRNA-processing protein 3